MSVQVAFVGIGLMGQAMCKNLVQKGKLDKPLIIFNRTKKRAVDLSERIGHCVLAESVEEAVKKSDIIFSCLTNDDAVNGTFDKALSVDVSGKLFVECSTTNPETTDALFEKVKAAGGHYVAMPVFGEPSMAEMGLLTCVPAGDAEQVNKVKPYLEGVIGRAVIDFSGVACSKALTLKVVGNIFIVNMIETLSEGHVLAEKTGLGVENLQKFIQAIFPGPFMLYSKRMSTGDYFGKEEPIVSIDMARNVASHVLELARATGTSLKAYEVAERHMQVVQKTEGSKGDISGIYGAVRLESGLKYENK